MIRIFMISVTFFAAFFAVPASVSAQQQSKEPLEVTADESLDWDREAQTFTARVNARAEQGPSAIDAQTLTAHYRDSAQNNFDIYEIVADSQVIISSRDSKAYGDHAIYDVKKGFATLIGDDLKLISPDQTLTARDKFDYYVNEGKLEAHGDAKVVRLEDTLEADIIVAYMRQNEQGQRVLDRIVAKGNVTVTTPTERATGTHGVYYAATNQATLSGGVTVTRGPNILQGSKALVDMNTNTSRMIGGTPSSGGRVRGVFYPGSEKSNP